MFISLSSNLKAQTLLFIKANHINFKEHLVLILRNIKIKNYFTF